MDKLELKYFNNIERLKNSDDFKEKFGEQYKVRNIHQIEVEYLKKLNQGYTRINNFFEFYINGIPLNKFIDKFYDNSETLLNCQSSQIGYNLDSYKIDELVINSFLKKSITNEDLKLLTTEQRNKEWFIDLIDELNQGITDNNFFRFYICSVCGDSYCHMTLGKVVKNENSFSWFFENFKNEILEFEFDNDEYIRVFNNYLKNKFTANKVYKK